MLAKLRSISHLKTFLSFCLVILMISPFLSQLTIPPLMASYNINIAQDNLAVKITGEFLQGVKSPYVNATGIFALLPNFHGSLQAGNSSQLTTVLTKAIRERSPEATVSQVSLIVDSNGNSNQTRVHYDLSFNLQNMTGSSGSICCKTIDMSWRAFLIKDDFDINQISINKMIPSYLQSNIVSQSQAPETGTVGAGVQTFRTWYVNSHRTQAALVPSLTRNRALFNFTSLSQPLPTWSLQTDFTRSRIFLNSAAGFNLTFNVQFIEEGETSLVAVNAVNNLNVTIEAPLGARIESNDLILETSGLIPQVMLAIIVGSLLVLAISYLFERRIQRRTPFRKAEKTRRVGNRPDKT